MSAEQIVETEEEWEEAVEGAPTTPLLFTAAAAEPAAAQGVVRELCELSAALVPHIPRLGRGGVAGHLHARDRSDYGGRPLLGRPRRLRHDKHDRGGEAGAAVLASGSPPIHLESSQRSDVMKSA